MSYTCDFYINSGFNKNNIPDSAVLLNSPAIGHVSVPALDILQDEGLTAVSVKASYSVIKNADYAKIGDWYYFIPANGIKMTSSDVARISLIPDYITTVGLSNLVVLDGITDRVHIPKNTDTYGAYEEDDPLMSPVQPMQLQTEWVSDDNGKVYGTFVESVLDLEAMGFDDTGYTYTDPNTNEEVCVPQSIQKDDHTEYEIYDGVNLHSNNVNGTKIYRFIEQQSAYTALAKGIAKAFSMGIENGGVINKFNLPLNVQSQIAIDQTYDNGTVPGSTEVTRGIDKLTANKITWNGGIPYSYATVKNEKINYSPFSQYGMMSASGEKIELEPGTVYVSGGTAPNIVEFDDPHGDGKPYFRFESINGDATFGGFWKNCISGLEWKKTPMIFTEKQGSALDKINYDVDARSDKTQRAIGNKRFELESEIKAGATLVNMAANAATLNAGGVMGSMAAGMVDIYMGGFNEEAAQAVYNDQRYRSSVEYAISQAAVQPQIQFPYNSEVIRDFIGNGVLVYRYKYTQFDIQRIDKLLTMYGYKHTKNLEMTDCFNRSKFNYVKTDNASFTGNKPKWVLDGVAMQFNGGVRIWHILPDAAAYNDNP